MSNPRRIVVLLSLVLTLGLCLAPAASAEGFAWRGGGPENGFTTAVNWLGDTAPVSFSDIDGLRKTATDARHDGDATLRIVVRALPRSLSAKMVLVGPRHLHKRVAHSMSLKLPAGVYTISAGPVQATAGAYYATAPHVRQRLRAGHITTMTVSYATLVPKTTRVVPASGTVSLVGESSGPRVLTLAGNAALDAKAGQFLASGSTAAAPNGYLVKITKVTHKSNGTAVLDIQNATLLEALPSGEIDAEEPLEPPAQAASLQRGNAIDLALAHGRRGSQAAHAAAGFSLHATNLTCTTSAGVHIDAPTVTFSPSIALHAHWGFFKLDSASFTATVAASLGMSASADAGAHCETEDPGLGLLPHPVQLPDIDVQVGPVPVVITPTLQLYLSGNASITAKVSVSIEQTASATVGVSYEHGRFSPIESFPEHFKQSFATEGDATAELALTPTVDTLIYGVTGPSFDIGAAAKFDADIHATPWWTLQGCLQAGLGFVIKPLDLDWSDPHLIQLCKTLLSATTGPPSAGSGAPPGGGSGVSGSGEATVEVTNPGDQTSMMGTPVYLQIQATDSDQGSLSYAASGLPPGLSIDQSTGLITGISTNQGVSSVTVTATDSSGPSNSASFTWTIGAYPGTTPSPGPPWTISLPGADDHVVEAPTGDVLADCSAITPAGSIAWALTPEGSPFCDNAVGDSQGNWYLQTNTQSGPVVESVDSIGGVRWSQPEPTNTNPEAGGYDEVGLGENGLAYVAENERSGGGQIIGYDETSGHISPTTSLGEFVSPYPGGLLIGTAPGAVTYTTYVGSVLGTYTTTGIDYSCPFSYAIGAGGDIFWVGYSSSGSCGCCSGTDYLVVDELTPSGAGWSWTSSTPQNTAPVFLAATPNGGVVVTQSEATTARFSTFTEIGPGGTQLWSYSPTGSLGVTDDVVEPAVVDANGVVLLGYDYLATCADGTTNTCSGFEVDFVSQQTGQQVFPSEQWTDTTDYGANGDWGADAIAIGEGALYVERKVGDETTLSAYGLSGLAIDYRVALQESTASGQS
jgi:hypothetical protein